MDSINYSTLDYNNLVLTHSKLLIKDELEIVKLYHSIVIQLESILDSLTIGNNNVSSQFVKINSLLDTIKTQSKTFINYNTTNKIKKYKDVIKAISKITSTFKRNEYTKKIFGVSYTTTDLKDLIVKENLNFYTYNRDPNNIEHYLNIIDNIGNIPKNIKVKPLKLISNDILNIMASIVDIMEFHKNETDVIVNTRSFDYNKIAQFDVFKSSKIEACARSNEIVYDPGMMITWEYKMSLSNSRISDSNDNKRPFIYQGPVIDSDVTIKKLTRSWVFDVMGYNPPARTDIINPPIKGSTLPFKKQYSNFCN